MIIRVPPICHLMIRSCNAVAGLSDLDFPSTQLRYQRFAMAEAQMTIDDDKRFVRTCSIIDSVLGGAFVEDSENLGKAG